MKITNYALLLSNCILVLHDISKSAILIIVLIFHLKYLLRKQAQKKEKKQKKSWENQTNYASMTPTILIFFAITSLHSPYTDLTHLNARWFMSTGAVNPPGARFYMKHSYNNITIQ